MTGNVVQNKGRGFQGPIGFYCICLWQISVSHRYGHVDKFIKYYILPPPSVCLMWSKITTEQWFPSPLLSPPLPNHLLLWIRKQLILRQKDTVQNLFFSLKSADRNTSFLEQVYKHFSDKAGGSCEWRRALLISWERWQWDEGTCGSCEALSVQMCTLTPSSLL